MRNMVFGYSGFVGTTFVKYLLDLGGARVAKHGAKMALLPDYFVDYYFTGENTVTNKTRQCHTIFYHTARLHGNMADVLYVLLAKVLVFEITNPIRVVAHTLGFHPLLWWFIMKAKILKTRRSL